MKGYLLLALAAVFLVVTAAHPRVERDTHSRGCIYILGRCYKECEEGTHSYSVGCAEIVSERTCDSPIARKLPGLICDLSRCECDEPNVKDLSSGKCVAVENCPKTGEPAKEILGFLEEEGKEGRV